MLFFDLDGAAGQAAVYVSSGSDAPLRDPLGNLGSLKFHTGLAYPFRLYSASGSITLPTVSANVTDYSARNTLFAHGIGSIPLIEGRITSGLSRVVRLNGSVVVQTGSAVNGPQFPRVIHLGADSSFVYLSEYGSTEENGGWPALTLSWQVDVMGVASGYGTGVDITDSYFVCGPFDSRRRYMRADVAGADQPMTQGVTLTMSIPAAEQVHWRYSVAGYVKQFGSLSFDTPYTMVEI